jgi:hypothetical protein
MVEVCPDHLHHGATDTLCRKPFTVVDAQDLHALVVCEVRKKLRGNEEVLAAFALAGCLDELVVNDTLSALIHALCTRSTADVSKWGTTHTWLISSTSENGERACSVMLMRYMIVVNERS